MLRMDSCDVLAGVDDPGAAQYGYDYAFHVLRHRKTGQHYLRYRTFTWRGQQGGQEDQAWAIDDDEARTAVARLGAAGEDPTAVRRDLLAMVGDPRIERARMRVRPL